MMRWTERSKHSHLSLLIIAKTLKPCPTPSTQTNTCTRLPQPTNLSRLPCLPNEEPPERTARRCRSEQGTCSCIKVVSRLCVMEDCADRLCSVSYCE